MTRIFTVLMLLAVPSYAATYYVDAANEGGTESGTIGEPDGTIAEGLARATAEFDVIYVKAGTYTETVTLSTAADIRIIGYASTPGDNGRATIDAEDTRANAIYSASGTTDRQFVIANFNLINCTGDGLLFTGDEAAFIFNVAAYDNDGDGISLSSSIGYVMLVNCSAWDNGDDGIVAQNATAYNCFSGGNVGAGFQTNRDFSAAKCVAVQNGDSGFKHDGSGIGYSKGFFQCVADANTGDGFYITINARGVVVDCIATRNSDYGYDGYTDNLDHSVVDSWIGGGPLANSSGGVRTTRLQEITTTQTITDTAENVWTLPYNSGTNTDPENFDYRAKSGTSIFDVLSPIGETDNVMQAYTSVGPKVQNVAGGSGAIIIAPRRHGN